VEPHKQPVGLPGLVLPLTRCALLPQVMAAGGLPEGPACPAFNGYLLPEGSQYFIYAIYSEILT
jgi:hypothetical protein